MKGDFACMCHLQYDENELAKYEGRLPRTLCLGKLTATRKLWTNNVFVVRIAVDHNCTINHMYKAGQSKLCVSSQFIAKTSEPVLINDSTFTPHQIGNIVAAKLNVKPKDIPYNVCRRTKTRGIF